MKKQDSDVVSPISFRQAITNFWTGYFSFYGTATRREYWYCWVFVILCNLVSTFFGFWVGSVCGAILLIPRWAVSVRRFHDVGLSGWLYIVPAVIFLVWFAIREGDWIRLSLLGFVTADFLWFVGWFILVIIFNTIVFCMPGKKTALNKKTGRK